MNSGHSGRQYDRDAPHPPETSYGATDHAYHLTDVRAVPARDSRAHHNKVTVPRSFGALVEAVAREISSVTSSCPCAGDWCAGSSIH